MVSASHAQMIVPVDAAISKYLALAGAILAALSPALFFSFGFHNDYNAWTYDTQSCCTHHPETLILNAIGRYLGAIAQNLQFLTISKLHDLWVWRLVGVASTALLAAYYLHIVSLGRVPTWQNVFLSLAVFTLPTMQFQALWVSMYMFWTPPILLSLIAAHLFLAAADQQTILRAAWIGTIGFVALLAGLFFYPASATFVLVPAAHLLLTQNSVRIRWMAAAAAVALGSAFVALFAIHKFVVLPRLSAVPYLGDYEFNFADNFIATAVARLREYLWRSAYFWLGVDVPLFPKFVGLCALVAAGYCVLRIARRSIDTGELINALMAICLFLVAVVPLLAARQFAQTFRVTFTMTAIELLVFFWFMRQLPLGATKLASVFAALGVASSFASVYGTAAVSAAEHALYARAVTGLSPNQFLPIVILRPDRWRQAFGLDLRGDLGIGATAHIFDLLIGTRYNAKAAFDVTTFILQPVDGVPFALEKDAVVIDTSPLYGVPNFKDFSNRIGVVSARPRGTIGPMYAIDGDADTFWEVCGQPFPIEFELVLPSERELTGYSMSTLEATERMPNNWEVWVTSDMQNWHRVQQVTAAGAWKLREARRYGFEPVPAVKGIKLVIMGTDIGPCLRLYEFTPTFSH